MIRHGYNSGRLESLEAWRQYIDAVGCCSRHYDQKSRQTYSIDATFQIPNAIRPCNRQTQPEGGGALEGCRFRMA